MRARSGRLGRSPGGGPIWPIAKLYGKAREGFCPVSCTGATGSFGIGGVVRPGSAPARAAVDAVSGNFSIPSLGVSKSKQLVRSPQTARRQGEMFVSFTPKRFSTKRIQDVWSNTSELTHPP